MSSARTAAHGTSSRAPPPRGTKAGAKTRNDRPRVRVVTTVTNGRLERGMQSFGNSKQVMDNMDQLYAYLKGRSDGAIIVSPIRYSSEAD